MQVVCVALHIRFPHVHKVILDHFCVFVADIKRTNPSRSQVLSKLLKTRRLKVMMSCLKRFIEHFYGFSVCINGNNKVALKNFILIYKSSEFLIIHIASLPATYFALHSAQGRECLLDSRCGNTESRISVPGC